MINILKRKISPNEKMYLAFENKFSSFAINRIVSGIGYIDIQELKNAIIKTSDLIKESRFCLKGNYWIDSNIAPNLFILENIELEKNLEMLLNRKFDLKKGPLCEILVVKEKEKFTLIFRSHHGIMDGKGQGIWIETIFKVLNNKEFKISSSSKRDIDLLYNNGIKKKSDIIHLGKYSPIDNRNSFKITSPMVNKIIINESISNLTAKLIGAIHNLSKDKESRIIITKDIRDKFSEEDNNTGNLSLPMYLNTQSNIWSEIYNDLIFKILNNQDITYSPFEYSIFNFLPTAIVSYGLGSIIKNYNDNSKTAASAVISNLGKIDLNLYSTHDFKANTIYALPVITPLVPISFVITELKNSTIITLGYYKDNFSTEQIIDYSKNIQMFIENKTDILIEGEKIVNEFDLIDKIFSQVNLDKIAIISEEKQITYEILFDKVNILSDFLKSKGVQKGDKIPLILERTEYYIIALLACLKLGLVFIPIDDNYPVDRIKYIVNNSQSNIILTSKSVFYNLKTKIENLISIEDIFIQSTTPSIDNSNLNIVENYNIHDSLYIIYTSGSTGIPKGVEITYGTFCNYIFSAIKTYKIDSDTIFGFFTSISFDLSLTAIFTTLVSKGTIEMFKEEVTPSYLHSIFENSSMNSIKITPTHLEIISNFSFEKDKIKLVIVGGEQLKLTTAKKAQSLFGDGCAIINEYGPTETTVGCTYHIFNKELDNYLDSVPIGIPLNNIKILLELDRDKGSGELLVGGNCLAKGYYLNSIETDNKFITKNNEKFYRTGDICKLNSKGLLEFIERKDLQIKIRGYRIEIEEIENNINNYPGILSCRIITNTLKTSLICYYIGNIDNSLLKKYLEKILPEYMIPYIFIEIKEFPLTNSGKLDLNKLKSLSKIETDDNNILDTLTPTELKILKIWENILEFSIPTHKIYENFYDLGADSLSMVTFISKLNEKLSPNEISLILENPTIKNISSILEDKK